MGCVVQKYGGTSVGSVERIRNVAQRVAKTWKAGHQQRRPSAPLTSPLPRIGCIQKITNDVNGPGQCPRTAIRLDVPDVPRYCAHR